MLYWNVYAYYQHSIKQVKATWKAGFETKNQWLTLSSRDRYSEYQPYVEPSFSYREGSWSINLNGRVSWLLRQYQEQRSQTPLIVPHLFVRYSITSKLDISGNYSYRWTPSDIATITRMPYYTNYLYCQQGSGSLSTPYTIRLVSIELSQCDDGYVWCNQFEPTTILAMPLSTRVDWWATSIPVRLPIIAKTMSTTACRVIWASQSFGQSLVFRWVAATRGAAMICWLAMCWVASMPAMVEPLCDSRWNPPVGCLSKKNQPIAIAVSRWRDRCSRLTTNLRCSCCQVIGR